VVVNVGPKDYTATIVPVGQVRSAESDIVKVIKARDDWHIKQASRRKFEYSIEVEDYGAKAVMLQVGVAGGADDSGDKGAWVYLLDRERKVIKKQFTKSNKTVWLNARAGQGELYYVVIEDNDTVLDGRYPGNAGYLEIRALIKD